MVFKQFVQHTLYSYLSDYNSSNNCHENNNNSDNNCKKNKTNNGKAKKTEYHYPRCCRDYWEWSRPQRFSVQSPGRLSRGGWRGGVGRVGMEGVIQQRPSSSLFCSLASCKKRLVELVAWWAIDVACFLWVVRKPGGVSSVVSNKCGTLSVACAGGCKLHSGWVQGAPVCAG